MKTIRLLLPGILLGAAASVWAPSAGAQATGIQQFPMATQPVGGVLPSGSTDFSGEWVIIDDEEREFGDYLGIPFNAAGRLRAETHDVLEWGLPEFQCRPHPLLAQWRGSGGMRITKEIDPVNRQLTAYHIAYTRSLDRPVYLDGRPHPSPYAPHTWSGFSTGQFDGHTLVITTTHLKEGYFDWNGHTASDQTRVTEWLVRHGDYLTVTILHEDPVYLEEPFVQSVSYRLDRHTELELYPCTTISENSSDRVPHYLPGQNAFLRELAESLGIPYEATRGGAETAYPEYRSKLRTAATPD